MSFIPNNDELTILKCIEDIVTTKQGCKATELSVRLASIYSEIETEKLIDLIEQAEKEKRILPINYTLASMPEREKTFYLPKGTLVALKG